jgi:hypothetical protein
LGGGFAITSTKENTMPNPNMTSPTGSARDSLADTQSLIALLTSLMPLLQRMQAQFGGQPSLSPDQFLFGQGNLPAPNPRIDHQAAVSFVESITADSLRNLSAYLDVHAEQSAELGACVASVTQAARCFAVHDYTQAFGLIWQAHRIIAAARSVNPQLPELRTAAQAGFVSPTPH